MNTEENTIDLTQTEETDHIEDKLSETDAPAEGADPNDIEQEVAPEPIEDIETLRADLEAERNKRLRILAEYDNFRRRSQSDFQRVISRASERIITELIPVLDDLERLLNHDVESASLESLREGVELIRRKIEAVFAAEGLIPLDAVGRPFDPLFHEAMTQVENPDADDGIVVEEVEKGYLLSNTVLRHSKVIVNRKPKKRKKK